MDRRKIPAIGRLLDSAVFAGVIERFGRNLVTMELRSIVEAERAKAGDTPITADFLLAKTQERLERLTPLGPPSTPRVSCSTPALVGLPSRRPRFLPWVSWTGPPSCKPMSKAASAA
jgi:hypothetical protein